MELRTLKEYVSDHPDGVCIRMVDGTVYPSPHRDSIWFTPGSEATRWTRVATSFFVYVDGVVKLVNALLVAEASPMSTNGHGKGRKKSDR